jgi:hypothetical protein
VRGLAVTLVMLAGCGRLGFDAADHVGSGSDDGGAPDGDAIEIDAPIPLIDLPCNSPVVAGTLPTITPDLSGAGFIAATATPLGLAVAFSSSGGKAVTIDLRTNPPVLGAPVPISSDLNGNLQAIALGGRVLASTGSSTSPTRLMLRDAALAEVFTRDEPTLRAGGPDHSAPRTDGGALLVGYAGNLLQVIAIDAGTATTDTELHDVTTIESASVAALPTGDHAVVWHAAATATIGFLAADLSLSGITGIPIAQCRFPRVVATGGGRVGISCICNATCTFAVTYDRTAGTFSTPLMLSNAAFAPTRMAGNPQGGGPCTCRQRRPQRPAGSLRRELPTRRS